MKKILFIAFVQSIHTKRWIQQIIDRDHELYIIHSKPEEFVESELQGIHHIYAFQKVLRVAKALKVKKYVVKLIVIIEWFRAKKDDRYHEKKIANLINRLQPDLVHTLETQHAGYLFLNSIPFLNKKPLWWHTNWGSDLYLFQHDERHISKIKQVMEQCDLYSCECERDVEIAQKLGFKGKIQSVYPNSGGIHWATDSLNGQNVSNPSQRKCILIKGYQGWAGRALVAFRALQIVSEHLREYEILIFSNTNAEDIQISTQLLRNKYNLEVTLIPEDSSHSYILSCHAKSRIYVGLSISDGISTSMLEAMSMGAFPIQSCTSCANEWIEDGVSGFIVQPEDPVQVAEKILIALQSDELVDQASLLNQNTIRQKANYSELKEKTIQSYNQILKHESRHIS